MSVPKWMPGSGFVMDPDPEDVDDKRSKYSTKKPTDNIEESDNKTGGHNSGDTKTTRKR